eukprot:gene20307-22299_t
MNISSKQEAQPFNKKKKHDNKDAESDKPQSGNEAIHIAIPFQQLLIPDEECKKLRFKNQIGRGSFGVVWKAVLDDNLNVAVKICSSDKHDRWLKEKNVLSEELNHKNLIKLIGSEKRIIRDEIALLLIFEYLPDGDLRSYLMKNIIDIEKLLFYINSLLNGLAFLHSWNNSCGKYKNAIAHRDIKSSNILISQQRGCVIADFGLAISLNQLFNVSYIQVGTARYMSPEKLTGKIENYDSAMALCKMDVYAAAIVSYEILSRCKFPDDAMPTCFYTPKDFTLPFFDMVGPHPTNDAMKRIVIDQKMRPYIQPEWQSNQSSSYSDDENINEEQTVQINTNQCVVQINYRTDNKII